MHLSQLNGGRVNFGSVKLILCYVHLTARWNSHQLEVGFL